MQLPKGLLHCLPQGSLRKIVKSKIGCLLVQTHRRHRPQDYGMMPRLSIGWAISVTCKLEGVPAIGQRKGWFNQHDLKVRSEAGLTYLTCGYKVRTMGREIRSWFAE